MKSLNRRSFLKNAAAGAAVLSLSVPRQAVSAGEKVVIGVMGVGGRGTFLVERLAQMENVEIAYLCDVNVRRFGRATEAVVSTQRRKRPQLVQDFRKMLDDKNVAGIVNATPDHWHALGTIMACQAGKDVFVEKPLSLTAWEGKKMVEAARKYKRIVQVGTQTRSGRYFNDGIAFLRSGKIGDIHLVRVFNVMKHDMAPKGKEEPVPNGFDWDMWCGPSALAPYAPGRWWFNLWEYSTGGVAGDLIHQLDMARVVVNQAFPKTVNHDGGIFHLKDGRDIPDTQIATYEFDNDIVLITESALWMPYMQKTPMNVRDGDLFPEWNFNSTKIEICGTEGFMYLGRHGGGWQAYDAEGTLIASQYGRQTPDEHLAEWIDCMKSRKTPSADIEEGYRSTLLCQLANASYRAGNKKLNFDAKTGQFSNDKAANQYLTKEYRKPWVVPQNV